MFTVKYNLQSCCCCYGYIHIVFVLKISQNRFNRLLLWFCVIHLGIEDVYCRCLHQWCFLVYNCHRDYRLYPFLPLLSLAGWLVDKMAMNSFLDIRCYCPQKRSMNSQHYHVPSKLYYHLIISHILMDHRSFSLLSNMSFSVPLFFHSPYNLRLTIREPYQIVTQPFRWRWKTPARISWRILIVTRRWTVHRRWQK